MSSISSEHLEDLQNLVDKLEQLQSTAAQGCSGDNESQKSGKLSAAASYSGREPLKPEWWTKEQDKVLLFFWSRYRFTEPCLKDFIILSLVDFEYICTLAPDIPDCYTYSLQISETLRTTHWRRFGFSWMHNRLEDLHREAVIKGVDTHMAEEFGSVLTDDLPRVWHNVKIDDFHDKNDSLILEKVGWGICWYCEVHKRDYDIYCLVYDDGSRAPSCGGCGAHGYNKELIWRPGHHIDENPKDFKKFMASLKRWTELMAEDAKLGIDATISRAAWAELQEHQTLIEKCGCCLWKQMKESEYHEWYKDVISEETEAEVTTKKNCVRRMKFCRLF